jgi:hypothetical protein
MKKGRKSNKYKLRGNKKIWHRNMPDSLSGYCAGSIDPASRVRANVEDHLPDSQPVLGTTPVEMVYPRPVSGFFPFAYRR